MLVARTLERLRQTDDAELSLRDVARAAGVSPTAAYRHFADKRALFQAVAAHIDASLARDIARSKGALAASKVLLALVRERRAELALWLEARGRDDGEARRAFLGLVPVRGELAWFALIGALHEGVHQRAPDGEACLDALRAACE